MTKQIQWIIFFLSQTNQNSFFTSVRSQKEEIEQGRLQKGALESEKLMIMFD